MNNMKKVYTLVRSKIIQVLSRILIVIEPPLSLSGYENMSALIEIRTVTYQNTLFFTICMLKSFYRNSKISTSCFVHIDENVPWIGKLLLRYHLPFATLVEYPNDPVTKNTETIDTFTPSFQGQKLIAGSDQCKTPKILLIDSDILFFRRPSHLIDWARKGSTYIFMEDTGNYVMLSKGEFKHYLGVKRVDENINTGIVGLIKTKPLVDKKDLIHLLKVTADIINERRIPDYERLFWKNNYILIEQTAYIYFLSKLSKHSTKPQYAILPGTQYQLVARADFTRNPTAIHYAGASKELMYDHYFRQRIKSILHHTPNTNE